MPSLTVIESVSVHHQGALIRESASSDFRLSLPTSWHQHLAQQTRTALDHKLAYHGQFRGEHSRSNIKTDSNRALSSKLLCYSEQGQARRHRAVKQANVSI